MGLRFPEDLDAWTRWQERRNRVRKVIAPAKARWRAAAEPPWLLRGSSAPDLLVVLESESPSSLRAYADPVHHLSGLERVAVLAPFDPRAHLPEHSWQVERMAADGFELRRRLAGIRTVLSAGHYLELGRVASQLLPPSGRQLVAQHGLLTPHAPPPPPGAELLAWSDTDADFWRSGRRDLATRVVGSELLAGWLHDPSEPELVLVSERPVYLGQLHGAELRRPELARVARDFCRRQRATYRPHPSERDRRSRLTHRRMERNGIEIERNGVPLASLRRPVVSVFSTGTLEAAARGLPAYVDFPRPPAWLSEFWERYDLRRFGQDPTPAPLPPAVRPAAAVAALLEA